MGSGSSTWTIHYAKPIKTKDLIKPRMYQKIIYRQLKVTSPSKKN
jgi:hypothetical protein